MARIVEKDPDANSTYTLDWTNQLNGGSITGTTWTVPTGITSASDTSTTTTTSITLSGGTENTTYELTNDVTTATLSLTASIYVYVRQQVLDEVRSLPVSLAELKHALRVTTDADDAHLSEMLAAAVDFLESVTQRDFVNRTWTVYCSEFPSDGWTLEQYPVRSLARIRYYDENNAIQTLDPATYNVYTTGGITTVEETIGQAWPATAIRGDAVELLIVSGYGVAAADVPPLAKQAIKRYCRLLYDYPGINVNNDQMLNAMIWNLKAGHYANV